MRTSRSLRQIFLCIVAVLLFTSLVSQAQTSGNGAYGQGGGTGKARAEQIENAQHVLSKDELPPNYYGMFVDADVLINVKADEYVAVFGIARDGATVAEANEKMDAAVKQFTDSLKPLHVRESDIYVDFIAQPKIYRYDVGDNVAREKLAGFELKKNISIHYSERDLIDKLVTAATNAQIYDLIKVDYIVRDIPAIQSRLLAEASTIVKQKLSQYQSLLGIKVEPTAEIYAERHAIHYPTDLYDSYIAAESENVSRPRNLNNYAVEQARRGRTFYFNGLDGGSFDKVINPVIVEPVVQFTLYLKVKYQVPH